LRQERRHIQLNDRTFNIAAADGFQICANPLVRHYFSEDEIVCADNDNEYIEKVVFFLGVLKRPCHSPRHPFKGPIAITATSIVLQLYMKTLVSAHRSDW